MGVGVGAEAVCLPAGRPQYCRERTRLDPDSFGGSAGPALGYLRWGASNLSDLGLTLFVIKQTKPD